MDLRQNELLNALALIIGVQNLQENRRQSEHNDVQVANDKQAKELLADLHGHFASISDTLNEILSIVKRLEEKHGNT